MKIFLVVAYKQLFQIRHPVSILLVSGTRNKKSSLLEIHTFASSYLNSKSETCSRNIHSICADCSDMSVGSSTAADCPDKQDFSCTAGNQDSSTATIGFDKQDSGISVSCQEKQHSSITIDCSEKGNSSVLWNSCRPKLNEKKDQLGLEDLPREVLLIITHCLPTVSLIACAAAHHVFTDLLTDVRFLNQQTRHVLGFASNEKDITYDAVPSPVAPLQNLWFQAYLQQAAPNMVGLVSPGAVFYDLLCFKHLLDTWILQGQGYKYWMFLSDVLRDEQPPPVDFIHCKRFSIISKPMLNVLTKVALCHPEVLLLTVNNFNTLTICSAPLSSLEDAWDLGVPPDFKEDSRPCDKCEVVSHQHRLTFASFLFTWDSQSFIGWSGKIHYSTFRWKETWGLCRFSRQASLSVIQRLSDRFFTKFLDYVGEEYISVHCKEAFMFRGLCRLTQQRKFLLPQLQDLLQNETLCVYRKICKTLSWEEQKEMKVFLDGVHFIGNNEILVLSESPHKKHELSKILEVAIQRYLHRYLNYMIGHQVVELYKDPICHHVLCVFCPNTRAVNSPPFEACMKQVGCQQIPFKIWPPHLIQHALMALPILARLVCVDVELWKRTLLDQPLSYKVALFVRQQISSAYLDFNLDPCKPGVIARRVFMQK